jgi:hypothetical protein
MYTHKWSTATNFEILAITKLINFYGFNGSKYLIFNLKMQQIRLHPKSSKMRYKIMSMGSRTMNFFDNYKVRYIELFCISQSW